MPVPVTLEQVFDVGQDASAKQRFINGRFNLINCPNCRFQGQVPTALLYHDPDKDLLLSFVPMEMGLPQMEQEKVIGKFMQEVISKLPQDKRKGYLLNPKPAFTLQGMIERVLEADGVTKDMLDAQKTKVQLAQTLLTAPEEQLPALIEQNDAQLDETFFQLLMASTEATAASGNRAATERMVALQRRLLELSSFGKKIRQRQQTIESVGRELQALGQALNGNVLLDKVLTAADDADQLAAYASFARPLMDYAFFEALTRRVDKAQSADKERLSKARDQLLQYTQEIDKSAQAQMNEAASLLRSLLEARDLNQALLENLQRLDDTFLAVLNMNIEAAQRANQTETLQRLNQISEAIMGLMQEAAPPELRFINELLGLDSDAAAETALLHNKHAITPELVETLNYVADSLRQNQQTALAGRADHLRGVALGELMAQNFQK
jgi:hypothetical protein